jgi:hypothetical protein
LKTYAGSRSTLPRASLRPTASAKRWLRRSLRPDSQVLSWARRRSRASDPYLSGPNAHDLQVGPERPSIGN